MQKSSCATYCIADLILDVGFSASERRIFWHVPICQTYMCVGKRSCSTEYRALQGNGLKVRTRNGDNDYIITGSDSLDEVSASYPP